MLRWGVGMGTALAILLTFRWFYVDFTPDPSLSPGVDSIPRVRENTVSFAIPPRPKGKTWIPATPVGTTQIAPQKSPPSPTAVEFEVFEGYAIAYGDIILGQVGPDQKIQHGYYEPRPTQFWEKEIPYAIRETLPHPERVEEAIQYFQKNTGLSFVPYQGQSDAIIFEPGGPDCTSALGRIGGLQPIRLADECRPAQIIHEIMHALGFFHEQSRPDRDEYLTIHWENIEERYRLQFAVVPPSYLEVLGDSAFDFNSVMLYRSHDFALQNQLPTLSSKKSDPIEPVPYGLSNGDLKRLHRIYGN